MRIIYSIDTNDFITIIPLITGMVQTFYETLVDFCQINENDSDVKSTKMVIIIDMHKFSNYNKVMFAQKRTGVHESCG